MPRLSPAAKAARRLGIGSSDIATILGLSPYQDSSRFALWLDKCGEVVDDEEETPEQTLGHEFEATLVRLAIVELRKAAIIDAGELVMDGMPTHTIVEEGSVKLLALASLDGLYVESGTGRRFVLEAKHVGVGMHDGWQDDDDGIPQHVRVQTQWQLLVTRADAAFVSAVVMGRWRIYRVNPDPEFWPHMVEAALDFWRCVREHASPPVDGSDAALMYLEAKYPAPPGDVIAEMPEEVDELVEQHIDLQEKIKTAEDERTVIGQRIREAIGQAGVDTFISDERKASWRANKAGKRVLLTKRTRGK